MDRIYLTRNGDVPIGNGPPESPRGGGTATVTVMATDASAAEPADEGRFKVTRTGSTASNLVVNISVSGTAINGTDYARIGSTVTINSGSESASVLVNVTDDAAVEGSETCVLTVTSGTGYTVGSPSNATVNIADNDGVQAFLESGGAVCMEAENEDGANRNFDPANLDWSIATAQTGYVGTGYAVTPTSSTNGSWMASCELTYKVSFTTTGTYTVWYRRYSTSTGDNSGFGGIDGVQSSLYDNTRGYANQWYWSNLGTIAVSTSGTKTFQLRRREGGYKVDRIYLTKNGDIPTGNGPAESPRGAGGSMSLSPSPDIDVALDELAP